MYDPEAVQEATRQLLRALGEDPARPGLVDTPARLARAWQELLSGTQSDPARHLETNFAVEELSTDEPVLVRDIPFSSMCEHHLLPFTGVAHICYIPRDGKVAGLSKLARVLEGFARRLQVQERLTGQVADVIEQKLRARGVIVVVEAEHACMGIRGVNKPGVRTRTVATRGVLRADASLRQEIMESMR